MNQGIIAAVLSILFYLTSLLSGGQGQAIQPAEPPVTQQSYTVIGQAGTVVADRITVRHSPSADGKPLGTVSRNTSLTILDQSGSWYKIRPRLGTEGWVPDFAVAVRDVQRQETDFRILGFYPGGDEAYESLIENGAKLSGIAPLGWRLDSYGQLSADPGFAPEEVGRSLYFAGNQKMDTFAHVQVGASPSPLLSDEKLQADSIRQFLAAISEWGLKGALVDIDYIPQAEQQELFEFLKTLKAKLGQEGLTVIVALPWNENIDYELAAEAGNYIVLKANAPDQPGPLTPYPEARAMLEEVTSALPADKIILAVTTGGTAWSEAGSPVSLSHREVLELAAQEGASIKWDANAKTPYFQCGSGRRVWFENRYSIKYKLDLAEEFGLGGLALKNLGEEDSEIWARL